MSNTTDNFWEAFNSWAPQEPIRPPPYRAYYDEHGWILFLTNEDLPGNYIELDRETFVAFPNHARVVDGKLVVLKVHYSQKLVPGDTGTACSPNDVSIVVDESQPHQKWKLK